MGTGPFGTVSVSDLGSGTAEFDISVAPNYDLDSGSHYILTFSLVSPGTVDGTSLTTSNSHFSSTTGTFSNAPFSDFNVAISSDCGGGSPTCRSENGQSFSFDVANFAGLISATHQYDNQDVYFAADIYAVGTGITGNTGPVGAVVCTNCGPVPGGELPLPAALPLFATGLGALGLLGWRKKRKAQLTA